MQYCFGAYQFDPARYVLTHAGMPVPLRPQACELLAYLLQHRDRVVPKEELLAQVWPGQYVGDGVLHACVLAIRTALHDTGRTPTLLHTVRGRGYRFVAPVEVGDRPLDHSPPAGTPQRHGPTPPVTGLLPSPTKSETPDAVALEEGPHTAGEYKLVSVLCCGLAEASALAARLGPEGLYHLLQRVVERVQEVLPYYAGTLLPPTSAGGTAVFGAPVAQEDHARRAVVAALALQKRLHQDAGLRVPLADTALAVRMGVHSGLVVLGTLGQSVPQPTVVGAPVQVAQRVQERAAPGTILLSAATYQLVHAEVRVAPGGTLAVEGEATPMPMYVVQGLVGRQAGVAGRGLRARSPFVGRLQELALLRDRWEAVQTGEGQVVSLVGAPGMGKTRLLTEFGNRLAPGQVPWYCGHCLAYGQAIPYLPVRDLLRQLCALVEGDHAAAQMAAVQHRLLAHGICTAEDVALVGQLLDLPVAPEHLAQWSPETRQARTFALLGHLIRSEAQQTPLVLVVEDMHWIDPTSAAWLGSLVERLAGTAVLLLVTARPGYQPPWGTHARVTQLALPPLGAEESQAIVVSVPGTAELPAARCQQIVAHGAGNPFFVEELAWHAVEAGLSATPIPATVHAVLAARLDRLPPEAKYLVQHAAVIGTEVPVRLLQRLAGLAEDALQRGLAHLRDTEVLSETHLFPEPVYTFTHALTHEVAYGSLLLERRRGLHARIVEALERLAEEPVAEEASEAKGLPAGRQDPAQIERLAHHALRGEVWDKAVTYCQQAGARAFDHAAFREAVTAFEQALQTLTHLPEHSDSRRLGLELRLALGGALYALGEYGRCLTLLGEAEVLARVLEDRARLGQVLARRSRVLRMTGDYDGAIAAGQEVRMLAAALGDSTLQEEASYTLGLVYYASGDFGQATELLRQNVEAADRESGTSAIDVRIRSQAWLALTLSTLGAFAESRRHGEEALRLATLAGHGNTPIIVHGCLGLLYLAQGDLEHASQIFDQGLALCQASGNRDWLTGIVAGLGYAAVLQGRLAEGRALLEEAIGVAIRTGGLLGQTFRIAWLSESCRLAGRGEEAWQHARQALDLARQLKERGNEALALHQLGVVYAHTSLLHAEQAQAHYQQALELAEALGMRPLVAHCHLGLGRLYGQTGRRAQSRIALTTAIDLYRAMDITFWLPQAEATLAQLEAR